ncbi:glycosyltransferase [Clostridium perfringens]
MKKNFIYISDYIEGAPVVASVRYKELMEYYKERYKVIVINDKKFGENTSNLCIKNFKYYTGESIFKSNNYKEKYFKLKSLLKKSFLIKLARGYKLSELKFLKDNSDTINEIINYIREERITLVYITVPDLYPIYIAKCIKKELSNVKIITEVRDILNHNIGGGNPKFVLKKAEKIMLNISDELIVLSEGIYDYYKDNFNETKISIIKNGYNEKLFENLNKINLKKDKLTLAHIGSIYKGRNIKNFILALNKFSIEESKNIVFNIVGYLDDIAQKDLEELDIDNLNIEINIIGTVTHEKAVEYLINSDIAVILTHIKGSGYAIPGKVFEYIGAEKPILAVTEDLPLINLINSKYGVCSKHNINSIVLSMKKLLKMNFDFEDKIKFTRKKQAEKILKILEKYI